MALCIGVTDKDVNNLFINVTFLKYSSECHLLYPKPCLKQLLKGGCLKESLNEEINVQHCKYSSELWTDADWHAWRNKCRLISTQDLRGSHFEES